MNTRNYIFEILIDGQQVYEGYGHGVSAMEAFESAIDEGGVYIQPNQEVDVLALSNRGLGIRFKATTMD